MGAGRFGYYVIDVQEGYRQWCPTEAAMKHEVDRREKVGQKVRVEECLIYCLSSYAVAQ